MSKFKYDIQAKNVCTLIITNQCDKHCQFCVAENFVLKNGSFLTPDLLTDELINEMSLKDIKFITISGGEPSISPYLYEICEKLYHSHKFEGICVITNFKNKENLLKTAKFYSFVRVSLGVTKDKSLIDAVNDFSAQTNCGIRVQVLLTNLKNGFSTIDDLRELRSQLDPRVTIACSTLRLSNKWCEEHQADEEYWVKQGKLNISNRYIVTLDDGTDIVLRDNSIKITGDDPVEEEMTMKWDGTLHRGFKYIY